MIYSVICILGTLTFYYPPSRPQHDYYRSRWQQFKQLDFIGLTLFAAGLTVFLVGINELGRPKLNVNFVAITISCGAVVFLLAFLFDFTIAGRNPIFPWKLFTMFREFTVHLIILFISGMVWLVMSPAPWKDLRHTRA